MTSPMTPRELDLIKSQLEATTPGEWSKISGMVILEKGVQIVATIACEFYVVVDGDKTNKVADQVFIASSKSHVSKLLDEIERLKKDLIWHDAANNEEIASLRSILSKVSPKNSSDNCQHDWSQMRANSVQSFLFPLPGDNYDLCRKCGLKINA